VVIGQRLESVASIEDGHELAATAAFASQADPFVIGQVRGEVAELVVDAFLGAEDIGFFALQQFGHEGAPGRPVVGTGGAGIAEVVGHEVEGSLWFGGSGDLGGDRAEGGSGDGCARYGEELPAGEHAFIPTRRKASGQGCV